MSAAQLGHVGGWPLIAEQFGPGVTIDSAVQQGWDVQVSPHLAAGVVVMVRSTATLIVRSAEDLAWLGWLAGRLGGRDAASPVWIEGLDGPVYDQALDRADYSALRLEYELSRFRAEVATIYLRPLAALAFRLGLHSSTAAPLIERREARRFADSWRPTG